MRPIHSAILTLSCAMDQTIIAIRCPCVTKQATISQHFINVETVWGRGMLKGAGDGPQRDSSPQSSGDLALSSGTDAPCADSCLPVPATGASFLTRASTCRYHVGLTSACTLFLALPTRIHSCLHHLARRDLGNNIAEFSPQGVLQVTTLGLHFGDVRLFGPDLTVNGHVRNVGPTERPG